MQSRNTNGNTADTPTLATADYRFTKRSLDGYLRLCRIVSKANIGPTVQEKGVLLDWRDLNCWMVGDWRDNFK